MTTMIATQIHNLLAEYNALDVPIERIEKQLASYVLVTSTYGTETEVIACGQCRRHGWLFSELRHIVVHPQWRGKGFGTFVTQTLIAKVETPLMVITARVSNAAMIHIISREFEYIDRIDGVSEKVAVWYRQKTLSSS